MLKNFVYFFSFLLIGGCLEPYEFVVEDSEPGLVVESYISDKSFHETLSYPSDGRYFTTKIAWTADVINRRPAPVRHAVVILVNDAKELWSYTETEPGIYKLFNDTFKAEKGKAYKLNIVLEDEHVYEEEV